MRDTSPSSQAHREREHFDRLSEEQGEIWWGHLAPAGQERGERRASLVVRYARIRPGQRVLEIGCGTGFFTKDCLPRLPAGVRMEAVDVSPAAIERANARPELAACPHLTLKVENVESLSYRDCSFDAVIGSSILHHICLDRTLPELCRVLRPGGAFVFAEPNALNPVLFLGQKLGIGHGARQSSPDEQPLNRFVLSRQLVRQGLRVEAIRPFDYLHPSTPRPLQALVSAAGRVCEMVPLLRELAGSLLIAAHKPDVATA